MHKHRHYGILALALLAVGCATAPLPAQTPIAPSAPVDVLSAADPVGYALMQASTPLAVDATWASSALNLTFHGVGNVLDGVLTSAWAPAAGDATPSLTFDLPGQPTVDGLAIKLSLGRTSSPVNQRVTVDVWTSTYGGAAWTLAASGLTPAETVVDTFAFTGVAADVVRLDFAATSGAIADLLVCDVALLGGPGGSQPTPTPSWEPSTTPSTTPTATPSWAPSSTPTATPVATPTPVPCAGHFNPQGDCVGEGNGRDNN